MKTRNSFQTENTKLIVCSQKDNIEREGFVSIQESYNEFVRAGRQQIEYLKQKYPSVVNQRIDEFNMQPENEAFLKDVNKNIRNEDFDGVDYSRRIQAKADESKQELQRLYDKEKLVSELKKEIENSQSPQSENRGNGGEEQ